MGMGGGGSQTSTTTSGIDPEFKPYLKDVFQDVTGQYKKERGIQDPRAIEKGYTAQEQVAEEALKGIDQQALARQMANTQGALQARSQGNLGSARQQRANAAALADQGVALQQADLAQKQAGAQALGQLPHQAAQRYFGYLGNVGQQNTATAPKQGGK